MVVTNISNEEYHSGKGVSNSGISLALRSPLHYYSRYLDPKRPPPEQKAGQLEGTLLHCAVAEPDAYSERYIVGPDERANSKKWNSFVEEHPGKVVIKPGTHSVAMRQAENVRGHPLLREVWDSCLTEVSAFADDEETGLTCKCRPDIVYDTGSGVILFDLKTYSDASEGEFGKQVWRKGYYRQDAWYRHWYQSAAARAVEDFLFIAVESEYPYQCRVFSLDPSYVERGWNEARVGLKRICEGHKTGVWCGYPPTIPTLTAPAYARRAY